MIVLHFLARCVKKRLKRVGERLFYATASRITQTFGFYSDIWNFDNMLIALAWAFQKHALYCNIR